MTNLATNAIKLQLPVFLAASTTNREQGQLVSSVHWEPLVLKAIILANLVMYPVMAVTELQPPVKIVLSTTSLRVQGRLAPFVQLERSRPRETLPVVLVMLPVRPATKLQPLA